MASRITASEIRPCWGRERKREKRGGEKRGEKKSEGRGVKSGE